MTLDKAMQSFLNSNFTNFLVFEDDVMLNLSPPASLPRASPPSPLLLQRQQLRRFQALLGLPPAVGWDMQYLGFCFECGGGRRGQQQQQQGEQEEEEEEGESELYTEAIFPLCTHALLMSREAVHVVMNTYKPLTTNKGDWGLHVTACAHNLRVLRPHLPLFLQNVTAATVGSSQLGNYNDKRAFASWVSCKKEKQTCGQVRREYLASISASADRSSGPSDRFSGPASSDPASSSQPISSDRSSGPVDRFRGSNASSYSWLLRHELSYVSGIPRNYII
jgi:hypothetical protein